MVTACTHAKSLSVMFYSLQPYGLQPARFLCPWDSPGKNAGLGYHAHLHGIFPTEESNLHFFGHLHWQADSNH